ncbi:UDP-N-acetylmuramoyl-tripeptide--D-alanyl-D-alanine ligase [Desulfolucanica intricata]|uniref:UDP-N-acetylmuramoyl-tripeptide--D-alanyl-D- alanine ligase n=1 Tax=Desulfolucanica intricata TaxID=1285191 RepID=UPI00082D700A|nr:UDP-N-acetylmuramoyl-tripeptide--D-alanyl-D-alanine ligase [Desulfolucanica intricata]
MIPMDIEVVARATGAKIIQGNPKTPVSAVSTDTRKLKSGDLFFALRGENFDAHDFIERGEVEEAGAVVISRDLSGVSFELPVLQVEDTLKALQALAAYNRQQLDIPVIGITGSNGKTSTKDMVARVLGVRYKTLKTSGNFNNEIGLPLTLLDLDASYQAAVVEMAMRGPGEIDFLCSLAHPTGAVITNIGEAHIERLGSRENIARAKGEILEYILPSGFAVLNADSFLTRQEAYRSAGKVIFYGTEQPVDILASDISLGNKGSNFIVMTPYGKVDVFLPVPGRHNVLNALAAVGVGLEMGLSLEDIKQGLSEVVLTGMRMEILERNGITIINDAYNANPDSVKAALLTLSELAYNRRKIAVLGSMFELGARAKPGHREVGEAAVAAEIDTLITVGDLAMEIAKGAEIAGMSSDRIFRCVNNQDACVVLGDILQERDIILVKGSRGMRLEEVVQYLLEDYGNRFKP